MIEGRDNEMGLGYSISEPIYTRDGHLLLNKGTIISYEILSKLKKYNINYYQTLQQLTNDHKASDAIGMEKMKNTTNNVRNVFEEVMSTDDKGVKTSIPDEALNLVEDVIDSLLELLYSDDDLLYTVTNLIESDDYTYRHSVNVTILSILTAKSLHYSIEEIREIALGALLHDIGKALVKDGIIQKDGKLTHEEEIEVKKHPQLGYELIKNMKRLPESVKNIVYMHHEKLDGSGYPQGLAGLSIPKFVRIITVCDMYDAMTTNRIYRKRMPIYTALEILMKDAVQKIDPDVYRKMTSTICIYPTGQGVLLSNGKIGVVSKYRHSNPTRPNIKIVEFSVRNKTVEVDEVDLQADKTLFIIDTWHMDEILDNFRSIIDHDFFNDLSSDEKEPLDSNLSSAN